MELIIEAWTAGKIDYETMMADLYDYKLRDDNIYPLCCNIEDEDLPFDF